MGTWGRRAGARLHPSIRRHPVYRDVAVPPDAFLQATRSAEAAIVSLTTSSLRSLKGTAKLLELYAGCGTLTCALAALGSVTAYDGTWPR